MLAVKIAWPYAPCHYADTLMKKGGAGRPSPFTPFAYTLVFPGTESSGGCEPGDVLHKYRTASIPAATKHDFYQMTARIVARQRESISSAGTERVPFVPWCGMAGVCEWLERNTLVVRSDDCRKSPVPPNWLQFEIISTCPVNENLDHQSKQ